MDPLCHCTRSSGFREVLLLLLLLLLLTRPLLILRYLTSILPGCKYKKLTVVAETFCGVNGADSAVNTINNERIHCFRKDKPVCHIGVFQPIVLPHR